MGIGALRRALPFLSIALLIVVLYDGFVFYSRWQRDREARRAVEKKEAEEAKRTLDLLGHLQISDFYAAPNRIRQGQRSQICYTTIGAKNVRIEPPVKPLTPAYGYCIEVAPRTTTEYKLLADDGAGNTVTKRLSIRVTSP